MPGLHRSLDSLAADMMPKPASVSMGRTNPPTTGVMLRAAGASMMTGLLAAQGMSSMKQLRDSSRVICAVGACWRRVRMGWILGRRQEA